MAFDYLTLVTSQHASKPKFTSLLGTLTGVIGAIGDTALSLPKAFSVPFATGAQLDAVGLWVGASRYVAVPLPIYFSLDTPGLGFDQGVWQGPHDGGTGLSALDDDTYRVAIRAKIAFNKWDGTLASYQTLLVAALLGTGTTIIAADHQNMTMTAQRYGPPLTPILDALFQAGLLVPHPGGVSINYVS